MTWGNVREMETWRSGLQLPQYLMAVQPQVKFQFMCFELRTVQSPLSLKSPELLGSLHLKELKYVGWTSQPFDMSV